MAQDFGAHLDISQTQRAAADAIKQKEEIQQEAAERSLQNISDNALFINVRRNFDVLKTRTAEPEKKTKADLEEMPVIAEVQSIEETAQQYQKRNPELQSKSLLLLRVRITSQDSEEEILDKVRDAFPDPFLAAEALDFLIETSTGDLVLKLAEAKKKFVHLYQKEIAAGRNISAEARKFSETGLGTPGALRDLYADITKNPRDAATLFQEFAEKYPFEKLTTIIAFVLHSLGSDLKSKGPSIEKGELANLIGEAQSMQAILGVYRFFKTRMRSILSGFEKEHLLLPSKISFEFLSKLFIKLLLERFPSAEKVFRAGTEMGLEDHLLAELIIFSQMRDAVRQVSPRLFKSEQHRQDILAIFLEVLESLDEKLDKEEEEEES